MLSQRSTLKAWIKMVAVPEPSLTNKVCAPSRILTSLCIGRVKRLSTSASPGG